MNVNLSFRYLESDYVRALRANYASRFRLRLDIVAAVILAGMGGFLWQSPTTRWLGVVFVVVAMVFVLMLVAVFVIVPPLVFRRDAKFRDEYSLAFSSEGIHFRTAQIDSKLQWSIYTRALVDAHSYLLYYGSRQFTLIPKRVFESSEQQQAFELLLKKHISQIARRDA